MRLLEKSVMTPALPQCCKSDAFTLLARQAEVINSPDGLLQGALAIAMHQMEHVDTSAIDAQLQGYADTVRARVRGSQPQALLAHLHDVLFDEEGFCGNTQDYYNPRNSYLPAVLESRKGLPITLSLLYKLVADRLGLKTWGVGLPGHFLIALDFNETGMAAERPPMLIDAFAGGRTLTVDEARERVSELFGPEVTWTDELLQPASNRHWLTRILQNLLHIFGSENRYADVAAILEMEMLLWPTQGHLQRDLGLVLARIGMSRPASGWLNEYLKNNPDDPQRTDLTQLLNVLGR